MTEQLDSPIDTERMASIRHVVYCQLLNILPVASYEQALQMIGNLWRNILPVGNDAERQRRFAVVIKRFVDLRVTPDIAETYGQAMTLPSMETALANRFGDLLQHVAGFYRFDEFSEWRLNLPSGCAAYGYRGATGFFNGILLQPLDRIDSYFLLSSGKFDGPRAVPMIPKDRQFFR